MAEYGLDYYIETSSKTAYNSKQLFVDVAFVLFKSYNISSEMKRKSVSSGSGSSVDNRNFQVEIVNSSKKDSVKEITEKKGNCACC